MCLLTATDTVVPLPLRYRRGFCSITAKVSESLIHQVTQVEHLRAATDFKLTTFDELCCRFDTVGENFLKITHLTSGLFRESRTPEMIKDTLETSVHADVVR